MRFVVLLATILSLLAGSTSAQKVSFTRDVLPILSDRCFQCHGPDSQARKANLRLDDKSSIFAQRENGAVVVPGAPDDSILVHRITATNDTVMPPHGSNLRLSANEKATLRRWITEGAEWTPHWAFTSPRPPTAKPKDEHPTASWTHSSIDAYVLAKLETASRLQNKAASASALLRRVCLDLTGLPPTPAQLDAFVADPTDAAYERIVDQLLASDHYGERMAWPWLQASRYADTDGYQADPTRIAWPWRDWLVRSLNANLPFDQFTLETLAGDLLPNATQDQRLASGFLRNNAHNGEGGRISEETRIENCFDRTETMATVWMGMTFECARCHDHKYDPITQRDYYRLFAFFNQTSETGGGRSGGNLPPTMRYVRDVAKRTRLVAVETEIAKLDGQLRQANESLDQEQAVWEAETSSKVSAAHQAMKPSQLGVWLRSPNISPSKDSTNSMFAEVFEPEAQVTFSAINGWKHDADLIDGKAHVFEQGQYTTYFHRTIEAVTARNMLISLGSDDALKVWCNRELILQNDTRRGVQANQDLAEAKLHAGSNDLLIKVVNYGGAGGFYFRRVEESVADLPSYVASSLLTPAEKRSDIQRDSLQRHFRSQQVAGYIDQVRQRKELRNERAKLLADGLDVSVMDQLPRSRRRNTFVLERGNYERPQVLVKANTPSFLPPLPTDVAPDRLALAHWLISSDHPLTARVAVNRAWQTFFGRGLVATTEDFGRQGDRPSHPELLDWLAADFVKNGWDVKRLHRMIVHSRTYRQSSAATPTAFATDPHNELLGRSSRNRLPSWMLRDQALALSGRMTTRIGGKPVNPYQPKDIWAEATFGTIRYQQSQGADLYRRSIYVFWRRIVGPTMFFDTQARQACVVKPSITNTPLHALTTMNETGFIESARGLANRAWHAEGSPASRLDWIFRTATARFPTPAERRILATRMKDTNAYFTNNPGAAKLLVTVGDALPDATIPTAQLAALTVLSSIVLNLDEVLTRP